MYNIVYIQNKVGASMERQINCFTSYCHEDKKFLKTFQTYVTDAARRFNLNIWSDAEIGAGENIDEDIAKQLKQADVIFLLISPDYLASTYCYKKELEFAIKKHNQGNCIIFPILLRPITTLEGHPFSGLRIIPSDAKSVSEHNPHERGFKDAFKIIYRDLTNYIKKIKSNQTKKEKNDNIKNTKNTTSTLHIDLVKNGNIAQIAVDQYFLNYLQYQYSESISELESKLFDLEKTHVDVFKYEYQKKRGKFSNGKRASLFKNYLFEICSTIQKVLVGIDGTCVHVRALNKDIYETFMSIGYDEYEVIFKNALPANKGIIPKSIELDCPIIKTLNTQLHNQTHPNEKIQRDYITFTFKNLMRIGYYISLCISIRGRKNKDQKNMFYAIVFQRLDRIIGAYIEKYINNCRKIDSRLSFLDIGGTF